MPLDINCIEALWVVNLYSLTEFAIFAVNY